jgi:hypothetical protein
MLLLLAAVLLVLMIALPIISYVTLPNIKMRTHEVVYEWQSYQLNQEMRSRAKKLGYIILP